ncbi:MAG: hypothetical protein HY962_03745 [Ignavibacteriae bacterium]|nr:hypothetical protein [Ignavibacteriota bacterium]
MSSDAVNWQQVRTLVGVAARINARGRTGRSQYGRALSITISYGIASLYLAWTLGRNFHEQAYVTLSVLVTMYLACYTVISSYSIILLDADERSILQQFPLSGKTIFLSRIFNLFMFSSLLSTPFIMPLAVTYFAKTGSFAGTALLALILAVVFLWTTGYALALYNALVLRFSGSSRLLAVLQSALVFLLLFFYQGLPAFANANAWWNSFLSSAWAPLLPSHWFVAVFSLILGKGLLPQEALLSILAASTALLLALISRTRFMLLPDMGPGAAADAVSAGPPRAGFSLARYLPMAQRRRAGFDLFAALLARDRTLRFNIIPIVMMPVAVAVYGLITGGLRSPFDGALITAASKMHVPVIVFFLFSVRHVEQSLQKAVHPGTVWLLQFFAPADQRGFAGGVRLSVTSRITVPIAVILGCIFTVTMPPLEALAQAAFLVIAGRLQTAALNVRGGSVPFTMIESHIATLQRFTQFLVVMPFVLTTIILHIALSGQPLHFFLYLLVTELITQALQAFAARRRSGARHAA